MLASFQEYPALLVFRIGFLCTHAELRWLWVRIGTPGLERVLGLHQTVQAGEGERLLGSHQLSS